MSWNSKIAPDVDTDIDVDVDNDLDADVHTTPIPKSSPDGLN